MALILLCLLATSVAVELIPLSDTPARRLLISISSDGKDERFKMTGTTWIIASALLCAVLFSNVPHIAFMVLFLFIVGDAVSSWGWARRLRIGDKDPGRVALFLCV